MATRSRRYAEAAYQCVRKQSESAQHATYKRFAKRFSALALQCGLAQAVAFAHAKGHVDFLEDLTVVAARGSTWEEFAQKTRTESMQGYQRLTRETLAAAAWLKRYAEALLEDPDNDDTGADEAETEGSPPTSGAR